MRGKNPHFRRIFRVFLPTTLLLFCAAAFDGSIGPPDSSSAAQAGIVADSASEKGAEAGASLWPQRYRGLWTGTAEGRVIKADQSGNIYVASTTQSLKTGFDILLTKYTSSGVQRWARVYNGPSNLDDSPAAIAFDSSGNIYVAGQSEIVKDESGHGTVSSSLVLKYDPLGNRKWVQHYHGSADGYDGACGIAVDGSDNIYVTGRSNSISATDYSTLKYDKNGSLKWARSYNGPGNGLDESRAIAVDRLGNVYITGISLGTDGQYHIATIKYDTNGSRKWVKWFSRKGGSPDSGNTIALDKEGNIYVAGNSAGAFATIKYNANGAAKWMKFSNGLGAGGSASAIAFDDKGNAFVTGTGQNPSTGRPNYLTLKYDKNGNEKWMRSYKGIMKHPLRNSAYPSGIGLDQAGNVYVTGTTTAEEVYRTDCVTIKYSNDGIQAWIKAFNGSAGLSDRANAIAVSRRGDVYITGLSEEKGGGTDWSSATTLKYDTKGNQIWVRNQRPTGRAPDTPAGMALDQSGNVFISGSHILKYSPDGRLDWEKPYGYGSVIATDPDGSAYVAIDNSIAKYDADGNEKWIRSASSYEDCGMHNAVLAVDPAGYIYKGGSNLVCNYGEYTYFHFVIAYDKDGNEAWVQNYDFTEFSFRDENFQQPVGLTVDGNGSSYLAASTFANDRPSYLVLKYDSNGIPQLTKTYGDGGKNYARAIAADAQGNIYVTGISIFNETVGEYATVKFDASGNQLWAKLTSESMNPEDRPVGIAVDGSGNVYVAGWAKRPDTDLDYLTVKYDANGNESWLRRYDGPAGKADKPSAMALDASGNLYVTGYSTGLEGSLDYLTIEYDPEGNLVRALRYKGPGIGEDRATVIIAEPGGGMYVTGSSQSSDGDTDIFTLKYR